MHVRLLRQRDPDGKKLPADDFDVAVVSSGLPQRLDSSPSTAVHEQALEFVIDKPGRYALRLERQRDSRWAMAIDAATSEPVLFKQQGLAPTGIRPLGTPTIPAIEKHWECLPRLYVDVTDEAHRVLGRPVFLDFATDLGGIGVPADSRGCITVGAAGLDDGPEPYASAGPPANLELFRKPDILAYDSLRLGSDGTGGAFGSSISTSFAAGLAAAALSSGMTREEFMEQVAKKAGKVLSTPTR
jgi:hypothetical protein